VATVIAGVVMGLASPDSLDCEDTTAQDSGLDPLLTRARMIIRPGLSLVELLPLVQLVLLARSIDRIRLR
jgi:hypothetical protein